MFFFSAARLARRTLLQLTGLLDEEVLGTEINDRQLAFRAGQALERVRHRLAELEGMHAEVSTELRRLEEGHSVLRSRHHLADDRFRLLESSVDDGFWEASIGEGQSLDLQSELILSSRLRGLFGSAVPTRLGQWLEHVHPDDRHPLLQSLKDWLAGCANMTHWSFEHRMRVASGDYRWFLARSGVCRGDCGSPVRLLCALRDMEVSRHQAAELEMSRVRFQLVLETIHDALWDMEVVAGDPVNPRNEIWWSPQFLQLLGFERAEDFPGELNSWASRLHPED